MKMYNEGDEQDLKKHAQGIQQEADMSNLRKDYESQPVLMDKQKKAAIEDWKALSGINTEFLQPLPPTRNEILTRLVKDGSITIDELMILMEREVAYLPTAPYQNPYNPWPTIQY